MADFKINGVSYKSGLIDGETQFSMFLRLMPVFTAMGQIIEQMNGITRDADGETTEGEPKAITTVEDLARIVMPVSRELAALKPADEKFIINACLDATEWLDPAVGQWFPVRSGGRIGHANNNKFVVRLHIAWNVVGENFSEMFSGFGIDLQGLMARAVAR